MSPTSDSSNSAFGRAFEISFGHKGAEISLQQPSKVQIPKGGEGALGDVEALS